LQHGKRKNFCTNDARQGKQGELRMPSLCNLTAFAILSRSLFETCPTYNGSYQKLLRSQRHKGITNHQLDENNSGRGKKRQPVLFSSQQLQNERK